MNDESFDLRTIIKSLLRRWVWIAAGVLLAALAAFAFTYTRPRVYRATATVVILPTRTNVTFDPRLETEQASISLNTRQEALTTMVESNAVLQSVLGEVGQHLDPSDRDRETLREMIDTGVSGDLIRIDVRSGDPETAALVANSVVQHYERHVNDVYDRNYLADSNTEAQVDEARQRYEANQQALETFVAQDPVPALQREIETRRSLLSNYQQTLVNVQTSPVSNRQLLLQSYYAELREIETALADAMALREQVIADSGSSVGNVGNALALILLRSRIFSGEREISAGQEGNGVADQDRVNGGNNSMILQLDLSSVPTETIQPADVDALISVLEERRETTQGRIDALVSAVNEGAGAEATIPAESQLITRISELEDEIATLQGEMEAQDAERRELEQARDQAWDTYQLLIGRQTEEQIASGATDAQVHVADTAITPTQPESRGLLLNTILAAAVAAMASVGFVLVTDWWLAGDTSLRSPESSSARDAPTTEEPAEESGTAPSPGAARRMPS